MLINLEEFYRLNVRLVLDRWLSSSIKMIGLKFYLYDSTNDEYVVCQS
jgi:hypothetical protein